VAGASVVLAAAALMLAQSRHGADAPLARNDAGHHAATLAIAARNAARHAAATPSNAVGWRWTAATKAGADAQTNASAFDADEPPAMPLLVRGAFHLAGDSEASLRYPAMVLSVLCVLALGRLGFRGWGPWGAAGAATVFVLLPGSAVLSGLTVGAGGQGGLFAGLMALGSYLRYRSARSALAALATCAWLLVGFAFDWMAYALAAALFVHTYVAGRALRRPGYHATAGGSDASLPVVASGARASSPLAAMIESRAGRGVFRFSLVLAATVVVGAGLQLAWSVKAGAMPRLAQAFGLTAPTGRAPLSALFTPLGLAILGTWLVGFGVRAARKRQRVRDAAPLALLATLLLIYLLCAAQAAAHPHLMAAGLAAVALCAIDLAAEMGAPLVARGTAAGTAFGHWLPATAIGALVFFLMPSWRQALDASRASGDADALTREVARRVNDQTVPGDLMLLAGGVPNDPVFHYYADRDFETISSLVGLEARRAADPGIFLVYAEPKEPAAGPSESESTEGKALTALLRQHPAWRVGPLWMIDLRRYDAGIRDYMPEPRAAPAAATQAEAASSPGARGGWLPFESLRQPPLALRRNPWTELDLDLRHGVSPSRDHLPVVTMSSEASRERLLDYHNFLNVLGHDVERNAPRDLLLAGYQGPGWIDPSPVAQLIGVRWASKDRLLAMVWECTGAPASDGANVDLRFVFSPLDHPSWKGEVIERSAKFKCRDGRRGQIYDDGVTFKLPHRGRWGITLELLRRGPPRVPLGLGPVDVAQILYGRG